jgi:hypothetical protein
MSSKNIFLLLFLLLTFKSILAQNVIAQKDIIGLWQQNESMLTSGLDNVYRFYSDGKFSFDVSSYNYLSRLRSLNGEYKVQNNILYLKVLEVKEVVGGEVTYGDEADYNNWNYEGSKEKVTIYKKPKEFSLSLELCKESKNMMCIRLNYLKFYKIDANPKAHQ